MKIFISSLIIFFIIISSVIAYTIFLGHSTKEINSIIDDVINDATLENWESGNVSYQALEKDWHNKKKWLEALIHHSKTDRMEEIILEIKNDIEFKNKNQVIAKAHKLKLLFNLIYDDELPTLENII